MIKVRCFKCGNAFQLTEQFVANELAAEGISQKPSHYTVECPNCRQVNKVSLKRVRLPEPEAVEAADGDQGD
jgi:uncharacterized Zn finger protein